MVGRHKLHVDNRDFVYRFEIQWIASGVKMLLIQASFSRNFTISRFLVIALRAGQAGFETSQQNGLATPKL